MNQNAVCPFRNRSCEIERVDARADQAELVPLVDQRRVLQELRIRDADVRRVEVAGRVLPEDVAAEPGEERVHVVGVTARALLDGDPHRGLRLLLGGEGGRCSCAHVVGTFCELRVRHERDVLERDRGAVELLDGSPVRERVERVPRELLGRGGGREERDDRAVRRQLADPVVGTDDHVGRRLGLHGLEVVADRAEVLLDDLDGRALRRGPRVGDLRHRSDPVLVRPDADGGGVGSRRRRGQRDRGERRDDQCGERPCRRLGAQHVLPSLETSPTRRHVARNMFHDCETPAARVLIIGAPGQA